MKFHFGNIVSVTDGFYTGQIGTVWSYTPSHKYYTGFFIGKEQNSPEYYMVRNSAGMEEFFKEEFLVLMSER